MQYKKFLLLNLSSRLTLFVLVFMVFMLKPAFIMANSWTAQITDYALPKRMVAIDKAKQHFYLYEKKSPLALKVSYPCTTGQKVGDKQVVNDLRTPEGVYFIEYKIAKGLDFKEYGGVAYTLNYPNPVDKLRGKTGYGIWIHSKGNDADVVPLNTRGCIAIERKNILEVGPLLLPGTVVVVGENLNHSKFPVPDTGTARHLRFRMEQWTRAWANRSDEFFDFYDNASYTKAMPETFNAFKANKERLFKILSWINIFNREVHVLEGPGYWVTWSEQFYRAPNLSTEGIRRLYWQRADDGQFRIVGMEWIPRNVGMQAAYEKGQLVASIEQPISDASSANINEEVPMPPPLSMPETEGLVEQVPPAMPVANTDAAMVNEVKNKLVAENETNSNLTLTANVRSQLQKEIARYNDALLRRDAKAFYAFYDSKNYGKVKNLPITNMQILKDNMAKYFRSPWLDMVSRPAKITVQGDVVVTVGAKLIYTQKANISEGEDVLYWKRDMKGKWLIVSSEWKNKTIGLKADYLEKISTTVSQFVEKWRNDWLRADVKAYIAHYAYHAKQGTRVRDAVAIQKKALWAKVAPAEIQLSGLRVQLDEKGVRVDMTQVYKGKDNKGDKGTKTLILEPHNGGWWIVQEDWANQPATN